MKLKVLLACCMMLLGTTSLVFAQQKDKSPADVAAEAKEAKNKEATPSAPQMLLVLRDGQKMEGAPVGLDKLSVSTTFGEVDLPLSVLAGVRFAQANGDMTTFALANGDSLTGTLKADAIEIVSQWGKANINVSSIASFTMSPDLAWTTAQSIAGTRHSLSRSRTVTQPQSSRQQRPATTRPAATRGNSTQRTMPNNIQVIRQF